MESRPADPLVSRARRLLVEPPAQFLRCISAANMRYRYFSYGLTSDMALAASQSKPFINLNKTEIREQTLTGLACHLHVAACIS